MKCDHRWKSTWQGWICDKCGEPKVLFHSERKKKYNFKGVTVYEDTKDLVADKYTVIIGKSVYGMSTRPLFPMGFNQYVGEVHEIVVGPHLGEKVSIESLPEEVKEAILMRKYDDYQKSKSYYI